MPGKSSARSRICRASRGLASSVIGIGWYGEPFQQGCAGARSACRTAGCVPRRPGARRGPRELGEDALPSSFFLISAVRLTETTSGVSLSARGTPRASRIEPRTAGWTTCWTWFPAASSGSSPRPAIWRYHEPAAEGDQQGEDEDLDDDEPQPAALGHGESASGDTASGSGSTRLASRSTPAPTKGQQQVVEGGGQQARDARIATVMGGSSDEGADAGVEQVRRAAGDADHERSAGRRPPGLGLGEPGEVADDAQHQGVAPAAWSAGGARSASSPAPKPTRAPPTWP